MFADQKTRSLIVLDATGKFSRQLKVPNPIELFSMGAARGVDTKNRLIYTSQIGGLDFRERRAAVAEGKLSRTVMRIDFKKRDREVVGQLAGESAMRTHVGKGANGEPAMSLILNPLAVADDWAVLSDGSIALVYGEDYHVELWQPNGKALAATTIPFERRTLTNADKLAIEDSVRAAQRVALSMDDVTRASQIAAVTAGVNAADKAGISKVGAAPAFTLEFRKDANGVESGTVVKGDAGDNHPGLQVPFALVQPAVEFVPLSDMRNTYPAFVGNAVKADLDAQLWIHTTAGVPGHAGDAMYDVLNNRGMLIEHVRIPAGRSIVGFGRGGVVYLKHLDGTQQWALERVKVVQ
jgi:hypothetical protein